MDKNNKVPLYLQLVDDLIKKIENNTYKKDEKLPSERELCEMYGMSRITVRNALQELDRDNYIYKLHGKGTFVSSKTYKQNLVNLYNFTDEMKKIGKTPQTNVLSFKTIKADKRYAERLQIEPGEEAYEIKRLRLADDDPFIYETSYLPKYKFPDLTKEDLENSPMYKVFNEKYDVSVSKATEQFRATGLRKEEANYLKLESNQPAMMIKRFAYNEDELIEYTVSIISGQKYYYTVELS
ncbi:GntR family transcriptional regulator [Alkalibacterium gilvum]|uniref:GntR family transcriptional regulator n=1 Tax=Alkalibacterium gilvum TaxID=1130080 RepID=A0A1H6RL83_9LACT|nr:GntR family transcriptional regulator [Alkalibacterium gilvum]SEI56568.1 GntR family transcriptional regulator [Alkalibacterium gilvum]